MERPSFNTRQASPEQAGLAEEAHEDAGHSEDGGAAQAVLGMPRMRLGSLRWRRLPERGGATPSARQLGQQRVRLHWLPPSSALMRMRMRMTDLEYPSCSVVVVVTVCVSDVPERVLLSRAPALRPLSSASV